MKNASPTLVNSVKNDYVTIPKTRVFAEWNYNRFANDVTVTATSAEQFPEFPASSVVESRRPRERGVVKTFLGENFIESQFTPSAAVRNYLASKDDLYKYWITPKSSSSNNGDGTYNLAGTSVTVLYDAPVAANKVYVLLEDSLASFQRGTVQITTDGTAWTTIYTDPTPVNGKIELYLQANQSWDDVESRIGTLQIRGVRLNITALGSPSARIGVIEIGLRAAVDMTPYLIGFSVDNEMSDYSYVAPLGAASSNVASLDLFNINNNLNEDNVDSPFYGLLDKSVDFVIEYGAEIAGNTEWVRMATMHSQEKWSGQAEDTVTVSLVDDTDWMQTIKPPKVFFQNKTPAQIIQMLCDLCGFNVGVLESDDLIDDFRIPFFWISGEEFLWDIISSLSQETQTAVYFDEYGYMNITARNAISDAGVVWNLPGERSGSVLPQIMEYSDVREVEANTVEIRYSDTALSKFNNGFPKMETMWEATDGLSLRASSITEAMTSTQMFFKVGSDSARVWPFDGYAVIDREVVQFKGKEYVSYDAAGVSTRKVIFGKEEQDSIDASSGELHKYKNNYSGTIIVTQRGAMGTTATTHSNNTQPPQVSSLITDRRNNSWQQMGPSPVKDSILTLSMPAGTDNYKLYQKVYNVPSTAVYRGFGTRLRFKSGYSPETSAEAGVFLADSLLKGYYISIMPTTAAIPGIGFHEIHIWNRRADHYYYTASAVPREILWDTWVDIDVTVSTGTTDVVNVYINGTLAGTASFTAANKVSTGALDRTGFHVARPCSVDFEYFYEYRGDTPLNPSNYSYFDPAEKDTRTKWGVRGPNNPFLDYRSNFGVDDFGARARELREFDVTFDQEAPAAHSNLYITNEKVGCISYVGSPFGAKFTLINNGRGNEILQGEDLQTFGSENPVTQSTLIYGRMVTTEDERTETVSDAKSVRRRGESKTDFSSTWIQSKTSAQALGSWVISQIALGAKVAEVGCWGNPLIQIGDVVTMTLPRKSISADTRWVVVKSAHNWENGLKTNLTLMQIT